MSINAIAAGLGVSKPTIYLRWPSKIDLDAESVVDTLLAGLGST